MALAEDEAYSKRVRGAAFTSAALEYDMGKQINRELAKGLYEKGAAFGNETAQFRLGTLYATGALGVEQDPVKMMLNYYYAALSGSSFAQLALGYRYMFGLGVPKSCETSVLYYELAANTAIDELEKDGVETLADFERLSLSAKSAGRFGHPNSDEDLIDYYKHSAEKGDVQAQHSLGQFYYYGIHGVKRNLPLAANYFRQAAQAGDNQAQTSYANMLVKGLGVEQDLDGAVSNFTAAAEAGNAGGMNGLGYVNLYGLGVKQDTEKATYWFNAAAEQGNVEAYYNLGALYISGTGVKTREYTRALKYFTLAVKKGHLLAMHKLAQMNLHGIGTTKTCDGAAQLFKYIAERSKATIDLISTAMDAHRNNDPDTALHLYLVAAELGCEIAQNNAAWLLDNGFSLTPTKAGDEDEEEDSNSMLMNIMEELFGTSMHKLGQVTGSKDALRLFILSAEQGNNEARVKIGDYYYYAVGGVDSPDYQQAAHHYRVASESHNTQAMFNLGYMHEYGIGLPRDFHLAKRFYDRADDTSSEAHIPVNLALAQLWLHRLHRAVVYDDSTTGFPGFVISIVRGLRSVRRWLYDEAEKTGERAEAADTSSEIPEEVESSHAIKDGDSYFESKMRQVASVVMEEDMIVALLLCAILAGVVYVRQARNLR